jgi:hypothetical protein
MKRNHDELILVDADDEQQVKKRRRQTISIKNAIAEIDEGLDEFTVRIQQHQRELEDMKQRVQSLQSKKQNLQETLQTLTPKSPFRILPLDTILIILQFYEFKMNRYIWEFTNEDDCQLMKILFGYFIDSKQRVIFTVFPSISFPYNKRVFDEHDEIIDVVFIVNLLLKTATIQSLALNDWVRNETFVSNFIRSNNNNNQMYNHFQRFILNGKYSNTNPSIIQLINNCTNVTNLSVSDERRDFSLFPNLRRLTYFDYGTNKTVLLFPKTLRVLRLRKNHIQLETLNQIALLPHLTELSIKTIESEFNINPNLKYLYLYADQLDPNTLTNIFSLKKLETLNLMYAPNSDIIHPYSYLATNTSITRLTIQCFSEISDECFQYLMQNQTIKYLDVDFGQEGEYTIVSNAAFMKQLLSISILLVSQSVDTVLINGTNMTRLDLYSEGVLSRKSLNLILQSQLQELILNRLELTEEAINQLFTFAKVHTLNLQCASNEYFSRSITYLKWNDSIKNLTIGFAVKQQDIISLLKTSTLHSLSIRCKSTKDKVLVPYVKQNENLKSLTLYDLILTKSIKKLYRAAMHLRHLDIL